MKKIKAFTLIELLVVIAIIGVLSTIVIINVSAANAKSRDSRRKADIINIKKAVDAFQVDNDRYPVCSDPASGTTSQCKFSSDTTGATARSINDDPDLISSGDVILLSKYLSVFPTDPTIKYNNLPAYYAYADVGSISSTTLGTEYGLLVAMEVLSGNLIDTTGTTLILGNKKYYFCKTSTNPHPGHWNTNGYPICGF